jgi:hypothetical protein
LKEWLISESKPITIFGHKVMIFGKTIKYPKAELIEFLESLGFFLVPKNSY